jgi:hypothetical protein
MVTNPVINRLTYLPIICTPNIYLIMYICTPYIYKYICMGWAYIYTYVNIILYICMYLLSAFGTLAGWAVGCVVMYVCYVL